MSSFAYAAESVLLITLDSCRYDTFVEANAPNLKAVGPLYRAMAPSHFTFGSHASMFAGFTPGVADGSGIPYANPKYARIFKLRVLSPGLVKPYFELDGRNIVDGFRRLGFLALGSGAVGWFDPATPASELLVRDFEHFYYKGPSHGCIRSQVEWLMGHLPSHRPVFLFLNVGETHVPYFFEGAPWDPSFNPCVPFAGETNDAAECRRRQRMCLEFVDRELAPLLGLFNQAATIVCADHGDCWGEDGLWEHGIAHEKVFEVPLILRLPARPRHSSGFAY
jgi:hypothetical protein